MAMHMARPLEQREAWVAHRTARSRPAASLTAQWVGMVGRRVVLAAITAGAVGVILGIHWLFP